jgi:hypothetical protein
MAIAANGCMVKPDAANEVMHQPGACKTEAGLKPPKSSPSSDLLPSWSKTCPA